MNRYLGKYSDLLYTALRIVAGLLWAQHGAQKLFGVLGATGRATAPLMMTAGAIEFFGGLAIALGVFTSWVAFVAAGEMAVAYFRAHLPQGFWPIVNRGELAVLYCFIYLYVASRGGGRFTLTRD